MKRQTSFDVLIEWLHKNQDRIECGDVDYYAILAKVVKLKEEDDSAITLDYGDLRCREIFGGKKMYYCNASLRGTHKNGRLIYTKN